MAQMELSYRIMAAGKCTALLVHLTVSAAISDAAGDKTTHYLTAEFVAGLMFLKQWP